MVLFLSFYLAFIHFSMLSMVAPGHEPWDRGGLWAPLQQLHPAVWRLHQRSFTQPLNSYTTSCQASRLSFSWETTEPNWLTQAHQGPFFINSHGMILLVRGHLCLRTSPFSLPVTFLVSLFFFLSNLSSCNIENLCSLPDRAAPTFRIPLCEQKNKWFLVVAALWWPRVPGPLRT